MNKGLQITFWGGGLLQYLGVGIFCKYLILVETMLHGLQAVCERFRPCHIKKRVLW